MSVPVAAILSEVDISGFSPVSASHAPKYSNVIDGKGIAAAIKMEVKEGADKLLGRKPKLAVVLVGDRRDSSIYVSMKVKACNECGIESVVVKLDIDITQEELEDKVDELNKDSRIDGILVQLPLPIGILEKKVLDLISYEKDVDGLHPMNIGMLALKDSYPLFKPCTAEGCMEICRRTGIELNGKRVVVIGRSNIVGIPVALLLQQENATVTMAHSRTQDLLSITREADIIVAAIGRAKFLKADMIREGAVIIDVGINTIHDASKASGYRIVGDVDFDECQPKCKLITPVPGGVGPLTVALLMRNTFDSRIRRG